MMKRNIDGLKVLFGNQSVGIIDGTHICLLPCLEIFWECIIDSMCKKIMVPALPLTSLYNIWCAPYLNICPPSIGKIKSVKSISDSMGYNFEERSRHILSLIEEFSINIPFAFPGDDRRGLNHQIKYPYGKDNNAISRRIAFVNYHYELRMTHNPYYFCKEEENNKSKHHTEIIMIANNHTGEIIAKVKNYYGGYIINYFLGINEWDQILFLPKIVESNIHYNFKNNNSIMEVHKLLFWNILRMSVFIDGNHAYLCESKRKTLLTLEEKKKSCLMHYRASLEVPVIEIEPLLSVKKIII